MTSSSCSRGCPAPGSPRWPSTRSTPRASGATWSRCRRTPGSSWGRWRSPTSTSSRGSRRPSRSTRSPPAGTRARPSAPSPRSTTTSGCSSPGWATRTAPTAAARSAGRRRSRSSTRSWSSPRGRSSRCWRPWSGAARASTRSCSATWRARGSRAPGSTARCASSPSRSACPRTTSTRSRSWSTAWSPSPTSGAASPTPSRRRSSSPRGSRRSRCRRTTAGEEIQNFSQALACTFCGLSFDELAPRNFSFNSPYGACQTCDGLGVRLEVDAELVVPDPDLTINEGAIAPWASNTLEYWYRVLEAVAEAHGFSLDTPWKKLPKAARDVVLYGSDEEVFVRYKNRYNRQRAYHTTYEGVLPNIERRHAETDSDAAREKLEQFMREIPCRTCKGYRLRAESLAVTVGGLNISQLTEKAIRDTLAFIDGDGAVRARAHDRGATAQGDPRPARVPDGRRARLPEPRSGRGDARRRRGATDPSGDADRQRPRRRPLHPGRAVDRAAPARQPAADRHVAASARPGQHADRRRARRGDHHGGRPHRRHRAARGRARRRDRLLGRPEGAARRGAIHHRRVPVRPAPDPDAPGAQVSRQGRAPVGGRPRAQPAEHHRRHPARVVRLRHGGLRQRQVHAGPGRDAPGADAEAVPVAPAPRHASSA